MLVKYEFGYCSSCNKKDKTFPDHKESGEMKTDRYIYIEETLQHIKVSHFQKRHYDWGDISTQQENRFCIRIFPSLDAKLR